MNRALLPLLALLLLAGCDAFLPREKSPHRVCGDRTPIYADDGSGRVLAYAQLCYTVWTAPGLEPSDSVSDSTRTVTP